MTSLIPLGLALFRNGLRIPILVLTNFEVGAWSVGLSLCNWMMREVGATGHFREIVKNWCHLKM